MIVALAHIRALSYRGAERRRSAGGGGGGYRGVIQCLLQTRPASRLRPWPHAPVQCHRFWTREVSSPGAGRTLAPALGLPPPPSCSPSRASSGSWGAGSPSPSPAQSRRTWWTSFFWGHSLHTETALLHHGSLDAWYSPGQHHWSNYFLYDGN